MNFTLNNKKFWIIILTVVIISFLWISTFGLLYGMKSKDSMSDCLFNNKVEKGCTMNFTEHVTLWQRMITSLPQQTFGLINILILIVLLSITTIFWQNSTSLFLWRIFYRFRLYIKQHPQIKRFNYLIEIFSRGILNTKIYKIIKI